MNLGAIFFDLDETLVSYEAAEEAGFAASAALSRELRPDLPADALRENALRAYFTRFAPNMPEFSRLATLPTRRLRFELTRDALEALGVSDDALLEVLLDAYEAAYDGALALYPDTLPALEELAPNVRLGIVTNGPGPMQREKLEKFGLTRYFDPIIVDTEVGCSKPDLAIFHEAEKRVGLPSEALLFVGNDFHADVEGARMAGWKNLWIKRGANSIQENRGSVATIAQLTEIKKIFGIVRSG